MGGMNVFASMTPGIDQIAVELHRGHDLLESVVVDGLTQEQVAKVNRLAHVFVMGATGSPDPVVEANRALLLDRSRVGIQKYGVTLGASSLSHRAVLMHALEEALDLANYLQTAIQRLDAGQAP